MALVFRLNIDEVGDMTGTQIAALLRGYERLMLKQGAVEGGKLPYVKYGKIKNTQRGK